MPHLKKLGVKRLVRYVHDIFDSFDNIDEALKLIKFINNHYHNLKFNILYEDNNQLTFLETFARRMNH